jgi:hypothetical protein
MRTSAETFLEESDMPDDQKQSIKNLFEQTIFNKDVDKQIIQPPDFLAKQQMDNPELQKRIQTAVDAVNKGIYTQYQGKLTPEEKAKLNEYLKTMEETIKLDMQNTISLVGIAEEYEKLLKEKGLEAKTVEPSADVSNAPANAPAVEPERKPELEKLEQSEQSNQPAEPTTVEPTKSFYPDFVQKEETTPVQPEPISETTPVPSQPEPVPELTEVETAPSSVTNQTAPAVPQPQAFSSVPQSQSFPAPQPENKPEQPAVNFTTT